MYVCIKLPACGPLPVQQPRRDGMDVLHAAMQQMSLATASLGVADSSGRSGSSPDHDAEDVSSSQEVTPRSSVDELGGSPLIDPDPLEVGKALARPKARIHHPTIRFSCHSYIQ
ncbi:hypothetical protein PoB_006126200 [Plakobranchus ocellatus]|uniref:Uncharacterized protein n=1 Tax=Plakobranchus ocellatus TaxID=259542 RepID=A0AAV4CS96_9GAST|nr:hypothetical protein PoB_006126200 [Plakobranchus ocellatus]